MGLKRKVVNIDVAYDVTRHATSASAANLIIDLVMELDQVAQAVLDDPWWETSDPWASS